MSLEWCSTQIMKRLSVIIITKDEAARIRACLDSVAFADEIIVLDAGSSDETVAICREYTTRVEVTDWPGFGPQKNRALARACGDWILSIDADETVSNALQQEIRAAIARPDAPAAYRLPRASSYCGRVMRHGGWWPDYVVRLVRRGHGRFSDRLVHEALVVDGEIGTLTEPLHHASFDNLEQVLTKVNSYSSAGARQLVQQGRDATLVAAIGHGLWAFVRSYVLKRGFLDGPEGFMQAVSGAEGTYYRYVKLMLLRKQPTRK